MQKLGKDNRKFLGLGSNVENRLSNLTECIKRLLQIPGLIIKQNSPIYESKPIDNSSQDNFLNMILEIDYLRTPLKLLKEIKEIEIGMGRKKLYKWGPRNIDIDILYFGSEIIKTPLLSIPHPEIVNRKFVLRPLRDIASDFKCPVSGLCVFEMYKYSIDENKVWDYLDIKSNFPSFDEDPIIDLSL